LVNSYLDQTFRQAFSFLDTSLIDGAFENKDLLEAVKSFTYEDFKTERENWLVSGNMNWFVSGNQSKNVVLDFIKQSINVLDIKKGDWDSLADIRCLRVPEGQSWNMDIEV